MQTDLNPQEHIRGRGASHNPPNRFNPIIVERDNDSLEPGPAPATQFFTDTSRTILAYNESPDIPFRYSLNPYRGCEHGCVYCYARPTHEYYGLSLGLDFETKIFVKMNAPALLKERLLYGNWVPQVVAMSSVTDPYQPVERKLEITRKCLQVFAELKNPVAIVTKNKLVTRDLDLLIHLSRVKGVVVYLTITTLLEGLRRLMEPRTSSVKERLNTIASLTAAGVPCGVMVAPVIMGFTDHELPRILKNAREAGAQFASYAPLRLPHGVAPLFEDWLTANFPHVKSKVINQILSMRGGKMNDPEFGTRMTGEGVYADHLQKLFQIICKKLGYKPCEEHLSAGSFRRVDPNQLELFEIEQMQGIQV